MIRGITLSLGVTIVAAGFLLLFACSEPSNAPVREYIIKTAVLEVSEEDFIEELDLKKTAYPYNIKKQPDEYNEMVVHLVESLSEELILLSAARDIGIEISEAEVDEAEAAVRQDYPEDSFQQMLLEKVISYAFWKKRFKRNMLIEKLIEQELTLKIEITSDDIVAFYKKNAQRSTQLLDKSTGNASNPSSQPVRTFQDEKYLVSSLRMQKTQELYGDWVETLWKKYPVSINKEKLKAFLIDIVPSKEVKYEK